VIELVALDVNETLFPLDPVARRMGEVGLDGRTELWFTRVLRDGIAASAAGRFATFQDLAAHHLEVMLAREGVAHVQAAVSHVLRGFDEVEPHPDVPGALASLGGAGVPAVALTNGSAELVRSFLSRSALTDLVAGVHDVEEVGRWKPAPDPYRLVVQRYGVRPDRTAMVAVHPWDLVGASEAGLVTAWLDRDDARFPAAFGEPDVRARTLGELVELLLAHGRDST
jgi:2-haloacid dehalogenase